MTQITLEIKDSEKENFIKEISKLSYVKIIRNNKEKEFLKSLKEGLDEAKDIVEGKKKGISKEDYFNFLNQL